MEEGGAKGPRMSKRFNNGEVDYNNKAGTAWSHSFLNQKPWHPLSYPNQRRKWIAEQTHAQRELRSEEVAREFAQEQEFFRQTAMVSEKEKEKMEMMKAVSFMYVRPPGYNAESAKAAEMADETSKDGEGNQQQDGTSTSMPPPSKGQSRDEKKKSVPKDVFGRALPTEERFEVLKNAPRLETGAPARPKPFAVEIRNVKCLRCGNFGHQSGDRECPLKDAIMPNEESRLQRDDPLTAMMAHAESSEPLRWELKQKPGMSPPRGGFDPDDPNQQIVAEDIFDEYGGFLAGESIPDLLANFTSTKPKKKSKSKKKVKKLSSPRGIKSRNHDEDGSSSDGDDDYESMRKSKNRRHKLKKRRHSEPSSSDHDEEIREKKAYDEDDERPGSRSKRKEDNKTEHRYIEPSSPDHYKKKSKAGDSDEDKRVRSRSKKDDNSKKSRCSELNYTSGDNEFDQHHQKSRHKSSYSSDCSRRRSPISKKTRYHGEDNSSSDDKRRSNKRQYSRDKSRHFDSYFSGEGNIGQDVAYDDDGERAISRSKKRNDNGRKHGNYELNYASRDGEYDKRRKRSSQRRSCSPDDLAFDERDRSRHHQHRNH